MFTYSYHWWVVPICATHVGAVLGAWVYYLAIGKMQPWGHKIIFHILELNWPKEDTDAEKQTGQDHANAQVSCIGDTGMKLE